MAALSFNSTTSAEAGFPPTAKIPARANAIRDDMGRP